MKKTKNEFNTTLLLILVLSDILFIIFHVITKIVYGAEESESLFNLSVDQGYAEFFQYTKFLLIIILLIHIIISTKCLKYISWICLFTYFLFDDAFQIHEIIGRHIAKGLNFYPPLHLRLQDIGELIVYAIVGIFLFAIIIGTYISSNKTFKKTSKDLLLLIFIFAFFGVFVDILGSALNGMVSGLGLIEDGGEMFTTSVILWYVFNIAFNKNDNKISLYNLLCDLIKYNKPNQIF